MNLRPLKERFVRICCGLPPDRPERDYVEYRGYIIVYNPKPIPDRSHDWDWFPEDYDGPEDWRDSGCAPSAESAMRRVDEAIWDLENSK